MPEGPEVECTRQALCNLEGKVVKKIVLTELSQRYNKYKNLQQNFQEFSGRTIQKIQRKGKFLVWLFNCDKVIINHLGMSGRWFLFIKDTPNIHPSHPKVIIEMSSGEKAIFDDARNFGQFKISSSYESALNYPAIKRLGVDGLQEVFPEEEFLSRLDKTIYQNKIIGNILLNQSLVAGVGNIYKSESLFLAKINPTELVKNISTNKRKKLAHAIETTLKKAVKSNGSTFNIQPFQTPLGEQGTAQNWHNVYAKESELCNICLTPIQRIIQQKRSTFFCPTCQK